MMKTLTSDDDFIVKMYELDLTHELDTTKNMHQNPKTKELFSNTADQDDLEDMCNLKIAEIYVISVKL